MKKLLIVLILIQGFNLYAITEVDLINDPYDSGYVYLQTRTFDVYSDAILITILGLGEKNAGSFDVYITENDLDYGKEVKAFYQFDKDHIIIDHLKTIAEGYAVKGSKDLSLNLFDALLKKRPLFFIRIWFKDELERTYAFPLKDIEKAYVEPLDNYRRDNNE